MRLLLLLPLLALFTLHGSIASAQSLAKTKLALHAVPSNSASCDPVEAACADAGSSNLNTDVGLGLFDVYILAVDIDPAVGIQGASFGIEFGPDIQVWSFANCWTLDFPSASPNPAFPTDSGSGVVVTSNVCQATVDPSDPEGEAIGLVGWLEVEALAAGTLQMTPRLYLPSPDAQVADCAAASTNLDVPDELGGIGFDQPGYDPCAGMTVPVETTTWGAIKRTVGQMD